MQGPRPYLCVFPSTWYADDAVPKTNPGGKLCLLRMWCSPGFTFTPWAPSARERRRRRPWKSNNGAAVAMTDRWTTVARASVERRLGGGALYMERERDRRAVRQQHARAQRKLVVVLGLNRDCFSHARRLADSDPWSKVIFHEITLKH
jgi:hypothetical protein